MYFLLSALLSTLSIGFIYFLYAIFRQYTYWRLRKVPCVDNAPILGNSWPVATRKVSIYDHCFKSYFIIPDTKYYGSVDVNTFCLLIRDPEIIRDICIKAFEHFPEHRRVFSNNIDPIIGQSLFVLTGEKWKIMRNLMTPSFTAAKMKLMFGLIDDCASEYSKYLIEHPDLAKNFDAKEIFGKYTCDVIATTAFGVSINTLKNPENEFFKAGKEISQFTFLKVLKILLTSAFPVLEKFLDGRILSRSSGDFFKALIEGIMKTRRELGIVRPDVVQLLMEAHDVSVEDVVANCFLFFLGGYETSSTFMALVAYQLAGNPQVQEKLRQEVDQFFEQKGEGKITYDGINSLKYLDMVLSETLRVHPPTMHTDRLCTKDYQLPPPKKGYEGYRVKVGEVVGISICGIHHDPKYFPEPEKFDPERFSEERKHEINPYAYLPFGMGPRRCIGDRFALMETKILFVHLIRNFEIKLSEKTKYPIVFDKAAIQIKPKDGFWMKFKVREKVN